MQQQKIKWWWSLRHHCSSSGLNVWVSDLKVLSPAEEERKKNITWKRRLSLMCLILFLSFTFGLMDSWICNCVFQVLDPTCVWSWPRSQQSAVVPFRSFCGLGLLSNGNPGSPYPKKHLRGTFYNQEDFHKIQTRGFSWFSEALLLLFFFRVQTLVKQFDFPIQHKGLHGLNRYFCDKWIMTQIIKSYLLLVLMFWFTTVLQCCGFLPNEAPVFNFYPRCKSFPDNLVCLETISPNLHVCARSTTWFLQKVAALQKKKFMCHTICLCMFLYMCLAAGRVIQLTFQKKKFGRFVKHK